MLRFCLSLAALLIFASPAINAYAASPYELDELFQQPYPFDTTARYVSISDDGLYVACGWSEPGDSVHDLWVYDTTVGQWYQRTDLWPEHEARARREFSRELTEAREAWEEQHSAAEDEATEAAAESETTEEFDEAERIEEFEEDLLKQRDTFYGISQTLFRKDSHELLYVYSGRVYSLDLDQPRAEPRERLRHEQGFSRLQRIRDSGELLMTSDSDALLWMPQSGQLKQLTTGGWSDYNQISVYDITPDLRYLATIRRDSTATRKQKMPDMLGEDVFFTEHYHVRPADTPEVVKLVLYDFADPEAWVTEIDLPELEPYFQVTNFGFSPLPGDQRLLLATISGDTETFRAYVITPPVSDDQTAEIELIYQEVDPAWINWSRTQVLWTADGGFVLLSEQDGAGAVYRLLAAELAETGVEGDDPAEEQALFMPELLWAEAREVVELMPLEHSQHAILTVRNTDLTCQQLRLLNLTTGDSEPLTPDDKWCALSAVSANESTLLYTQGNEVEHAGLQLVRLTEATSNTEILPRHSEEWLAWTATWDVQFISIPLEDGGELALKLWLPPTWQPGVSYPLLIWAHGAGYFQAVKRDPGWYTLFHPWVAEQHGWIVAEVDYRGSEGYGRDWRTAVAGRLGELEVQDLVAAKHHLVADYGADPQRTALWGWSYGGFLTLMALGRAPGEFPVGIAVAPVNRWENYFYWYATERLGSPEDNEDAYELSAAETYLDGISDDLIIVHGLRDSNTLFQSVAQYIEKGHEVGVNVELKLFPADGHGIGSNHNYIRIFETIIDYCEEHWETE